MRDRSERQDPQKPDREYHPFHLGHRQIFGLPLARLSREHLPIVYQDRLCPLGARVVRLRDQTGGSDASRYLPQPD